MSAQLAVISRLWQIPIARRGRIRITPTNKVNFGHTLAKGKIERYETDESDP